MRGVGSADGAAGDVGHRVGDKLPVLCSEWDRRLAGAGKVLMDGLEHLVRNFVIEYDVRATKDPAGGDAAKSAGELNGCRGDRSLANTDGDHFPGVPLFMLRLQLPGGGGHGAGD